MAMQPVARWPSPWPDDLAQARAWPEGPCRAWAATQARGTTRARPIPTVGLVKMNCCVVVTLYIYVVNCYIGKYDEVFQHLVKKLIKIGCFWLDEPSADMVRKKAVLVRLTQHENQPIGRALGRRLGTKPV